MELDGSDQYFLNGPIVTMSKHIHPYTLPPHKLGTVKLLFKTPVLPLSNMSIGRKRNEVSIPYVSLE